MKSKSILIAFTLLFLALVALAVLSAKGKHVVTSDSEFKGANPIASAPLHGLLSVNGHRIRVDIADTEEKRVLGLGERDTIGDDEGMLFVFPEPDFYGFWMKDMQFPLDIVWLDEDFKVVYLKENISPNTYPEIFFPHTKAVYVLEMKGNMAGNNGVTLGSTLTFKQNTPL